MRYSCINIAKLFTCILFWVISSEHISVAQQRAPLEMGVNVNERPHWLKPGLLEQSQTTWTRAFIEASHYIKGDRSLEDDFRIDALKRVADAGYKVLLSIKWNLKEADWNVPEPGSEEEKKWFSFTNDLLKQLRGDLSILVLVNEITIDTPGEDLQYDESEKIPFVEFQKRLLDYITTLNPKDAEGNPLPIYTGGFTRLDKTELQEHPANKAMFKWINEDSRLAGADFHMHQPDYSTTLEAANFIRSKIPDKPLIVTEFSLVWKWKAHLGDKISNTSKGQQFVKNYSLNPKMTVAEYTTTAFSNPVSEREWKQFLKSQPWYEPEYLDVMGRIMENHGVVVATYAFTQDPETNEAWNITQKTTPWFIHQLFMPRVAYCESSGTAVNYGMFESFVRWQKTTNTIKSSITNKIWY